MDFLKGILSQPDKDGYLFIFCTHISEKVPESREHLKKLAKLVIERETDNFEIAHERRAGNRTAMELLRSLEQLFNEMAELKATLGTHEQTIAKHEQTIAKHEQTIAENEQTISKHENDIAEITTSQEVLKTTVAKHGKILAEHENMIGEHKKILNGFEKIFDEHEKIIAEHESKWHKIRLHEILTIGKNQENKMSKPTKENIVSLARNEIVHGGDVLRDIKAIGYIKKNMSNLSFQTASKGFETLYGLSAECYGNAIIESPIEIAKTLDIRSTVYILRFWLQLSKRNDFLGQCESIISKWRKDLEGDAEYDRKRIKRDFQVLNDNYQGSRSKAGPAD